MTADDIRTRLDAIERDANEWPAVSAGDALDLVAALRDALGWFDAYNELRDRGEPSWDMFDSTVNAATREISAERDALAAENARLGAQVQAVEALHQPFSIYDECECADPVVGVDGHVDIEEVGITCNLMYVACSECCIENPAWPEQAEWCHDRHDHRANGQCPTLAALATTEAGEES